MNIFALDPDPAACARAHCDKHVIKMILEHAQMACAVAHKLGLPDVPYRATHENHPCTLWLEQSVDNVIWLHKMTCWLDSEKQYRFGGKSHKSLSVFTELAPRICELLTTTGLTPFAQALPDDCRSADAITAYRQYYRRYKQHLHSWSNRERPEWL